jgi:hypothetical protein
MFLSKHFTGCKSAQGSLLLRYKSRIAPKVVRHSASKKIFRMKILKFTTVFSTLLISVAAFSQNETLPRQYSPTETLTIKKGVVDNFKYQLFRFTTALEEKDQENVDVMKSVLMEAIQAEIGELQKTASADAPGTSIKKRLDAQKKLQKSLEVARFSVAPGAFEKSMKDKALFDDFVKIMEEDYRALEQQVSGQ